jgi:hypothetical protein
MFNALVRYFLTAGALLAIAQPSHGIAAPAAPALNTALNTAFNTALNTAQSAVTGRRPPSQTVSRRPRPPRRLPPNQVQPGGGLEAAVQSCAPASNAAAPSPSLTALVPVENPVFTASAHPTFLFYLPDAPEQVEYAEFMLLSADEKEEIYATRFVPTSAGVVSLSLPEDSAYALEVDQAYHWYFNLHCKTAKTDEKGTPAVNGWVQRVEPAESVESVESIELVQPADSVNEAGGVSEASVPEVWYDAIAQVAETLAAGPMPQNPTAQSQFSQSQQLWENWLSAVGLDEVVHAPVVGPVLP